MGKHQGHQTPPQLPLQYPVVHLRFVRSSSLADPKFSAYMLPWTPSRPVDPNILLDDDNRVANADDTRVTERILYFKEHYTTMLRQCDWKRVSFAAASLTNWKRKLKKDILRSLERLHKIFLKEKQIVATGQRTLSNWFAPASQPD